MESLPEFLRCVLLAVKNIVSAKWAAASGCGVSPEEKAAKIEEAVALGFILRELGDDGLYTYRLTGKGMHQWLNERFQKAPV